MSEKILDLGEATDPVTGFVSLVRLGQAAVVRASPMLVAEGVPPFLQ